MFEYIRHLTEGGEWKFSNVITVGELSELKTKNKDNVVSALNELYMFFDTVGEDSLATMVDSIKNTETAMNAIVKKLEEEQVKINEIIENFDDETGITLINDVKSQLESKLEQSEVKMKELSDKSNEIITSMNDSYTEINGKLVAMNSEIVKTNDEVSSKVSYTELDNAVGVNKWIATMYDSDKNYQLNYPKLTDIEGKATISVDEVEDSTSLYPMMNVDTGMLHLFTNVNVATSTTINLNVNHSKGLSVIVNGGYVYYREGSHNNATISINLRSGWNRLEFLVGTTKSFGLLTLSSKISTKVKKMTTTIGVGGKDETRLTNAETQLIQTRAEIAMKADSTVVSNIGNKVEQHSSELLLQAEQIASKVSQEEYNAYTGILESAVSTINQTSEKIEGLVTKESFDNLNGMVNTHETAIKQYVDLIELSVTQEDLNRVTGMVTTSNSKIQLLEDEVSAKASKTELDELGGIVRSNETAIIANSEAISMKADKVALDDVTGRIINAEASITTQADQIALKASRFEIDTLEERLISAEASITTQADQIALKVEKQDLDAVESKVIGYEATIVAQADQIEQAVKKTEAFADKISNVEASIITQAEQIELKASKVDMDDAKEKIKIAEATITTQNERIELKANKSDLDTVEGKVEKAEASITTQAGLLELKASKEELDSIEGKVSKAEAAITTQAKRIELKANKSDLDSIDGRLIEAEATLSVQADKITSMVTGDLLETIQNDSKIKDTRYDNESPSYYTETYSMKTVEEFKEAETLGIGEGYGLLTTNVTWDSEGEFGIVSQRFTTATGTYERESVDNEYWSEWKTMADIAKVGTFVNQTIDSWGVDVVRNGTVLSAINASTEGVKIKGDKVDITGMVTFEALDSTVKKTIEDTKNEIGIVSDEVLEALANAEDAYNLASDVSNTADSALTKADSAMSTANQSWNYASNANSVLNDWTYAGTTTINGAKIRTGTITADHVRAGAVDGQVITGALIRTKSTVGDSSNGGGVIINSTGIYGYDYNGNQKTSISSSGTITATDAVISGTITAGENSTFNGSIYTAKDITLGDNIYLTYDWSKRFNAKGIHFYANDGSYHTSIVGTYLKMDITSKAIRLYGEDYTDIYGQGLRVMGELYVRDNALFTGVVDFTGATVKGVTAVFG